MKKIEMPKSGEEVAVTAEPKDEILIEGIPFEQAQVDIIGTDVVVSDLDTGSRIVFPGMGLIMFERSLAPTISFGGQQVPINDFVSRVGEVGNLTVKDFIAISSIMPTDEDMDEVQSITSSDMNDGSDRASDSDGDGNGGSPGDVPTDQTVVMNSSSQSKIETSSTENFTASKNKFTSDAPPNAVDEDGDEELSFEAPPASSGTPATSSSPSQDEAPPEPENTLSFELRLLQVSSQETIETVNAGDQRTFLGGGGNQASFFNEENDSQFSTELADFSNSDIPVVALSDNPAYFSETLMSRVFQIEPTMPPGFFITNLTLTGVPDNFSILGYERNDAGDFEILDPEINNRGQINLIVQWEVPTYDEFTMGVNALAEFNEAYAAENNLEAPSNTELEFSVEQQIETDDAYSANDLNYQNLDGDLVWVMANQHNQNRLITGGGDDDLTGSVAVDTFNAGGGNDILRGEGGDDVLSGEDGNDILIGGAGNDTYVGGNGVDVIDYTQIEYDINADLSDVNIDNFATIYIDQFGENEEVELATGVENIEGGTGNDTLIGNASANELRGNDGNDLLMGRGGNDRLDGGGGIDTASYELASNGVVIDLSLDVPTATVTADVNVDVLINIENITGSNFADIIQGDDEDNFIFGGQGDDRLNGGAGSDRLDGGDGNDFLDYSTSLDQVNLNLNALPDADGYITATVGTDTDLVRNVESVIGSAQNDNIVGSIFENTLIGNAGSDTLSGGDGADTLDGGEGNDILNGDAGNDTFIAGLGQDIINGGSGIDLVDYSGLGADYIEATLNNGILSSIIVHGEGLDNDGVQFVESIIGTDGDDRLVGDDSENTLIGGAGNDYLAGRIGEDVLDGGEGVDTADFTQAGGAIDIELRQNRVINDGDGYEDTIISIEDILGSEFDDEIRGSDSANTLDGFNGDDRLAGRGGIDRLNGGGGDDDEADYSDAASGIVVDMNIDSEDGPQVTNDGDGAQDYFDGIENVRGSAFADLITGDTNDNDFFGMAGNDMFIASTGGDTYDGGDNLDTVDYSSFVATSLSVQLTADVSATVTLNGVPDNDTVVNVENIIGTSGGDEIRGDELTNRLDGFEGNDVIYGGLGDDELIGGDDYDELRFDDFDGLATGITLNLVTERAAFSFDNSEDIFSEFEEYFLTNQDDTIFGSGGVDRVNARAGDDTIIASGSADIFDGGDGFDTIDYSGFLATNFISVDLDGVNPASLTVNNGSVDTLTNIENVTGSQGNDSIIGDGEINIFLGDQGADFLSGEGGDDVLQGGLGDDVLRGGAGDDVLRGGNVNTGQGEDTADYQDSTNGIFADMTESVVSDGFGTTDTLVGIDNITGSANDDIIIGNAFRNRLLGLDGNDTISGGGEGDFMDGGDHGPGPTDGDTLTFLDLTDGFVDINLQTGESDYSFDGSTDTFQNFEYFILTNQNDRMTGSSGVDNVELRGGDDIVNASSGIDILDGGAGSDTIDYSGLAGVGANGITIELEEENEITVIVDNGDNDLISAFENVIGSSQGDDIRGDALANALSGAGGDDVIRGGSGSDTFDGGDGNDQLWFDDLIGSGVTINFDANNATHVSNTDTFQNFEEFYMSNQIDVINSHTGSQVVYGLGGADTFNASSGSDTFDGGAGSDLIDYSGMAAAQSISVTLNDDNPATVTITTAGGPETDTISDIENVRGTDGVDTITGDDASNTFYGGNSADNLDGQAGSDTLFGEDGDDILKGRSGTDTLNGGFGRDTADYTDAAINGIDVNMALFTVSDDGDGNGDSLISIENIRGSSFGDNIIGDAGSNYIWGEGGNDIIRGGEGDDQFYGGEEVGDLDILRFDDLVNDGILLDIQAGTATYLFNNDIDTFEGFERYFGTNLGDTITGSSDADDIRSLDGDDTFTASNGADYLDGGLGNDTIDYSQMTNAGIGISVALDTTNVATVTIVGTGTSNDDIRAFENITGSIGDDTISGDILNNIIIGHDGADVLAGRGGADNIYGGREDRTDDSAGDTVDYSNAAGSVTVDLSLERALADGDSSTDNLYDIENVIGSLVVDDLRGDDEDNILDGNFGNDTLYGAGGDDTLDGGEDDDYADYDRAAAGVTIDMRITGGPQTTDDGDGGQDTLLNIENLRGSDYADDMTGDDFNNIIEGGQGEDILRGQGGDDILRGGANADTVDYTFAGNSVSVDLSANVTSNDGQGGQDTLDSIENVIGSTVNDIIVGNGTSNVLDGNGGDDTLRGLGGNDTLDGGAHGVNGDTADYSLAGAGITADMSLGANQVSDDGDLGQDTLINIENITGSDHADDITGDNNANVIRGGLEVDILEGRGGNDTIHGGDGIDTLAFRYSDRGATVDLSANKVWDDGFGLAGQGGEDDVFTVENILGSDYGDDLTGDSGNNLIQGGDGDDILRGRAGVDDLQGGAGNDDTIDYSLAATAVEVDMSINTTSNDGDGTTDTFSGIENVNGSNFNDILHGDDNVLGNYLFGGAGDDELYGAGADDVLDGGSEGATGDTAIYTRADAAITVDMSLANNQVSDDGDGGQDTLINIENITGSNFDDDITGDQFNNRLRGGQGEDILDGAGGDDLIEAGANNDTIIASLGADVIDGEGGVDELDYSGLAEANYISVTLQGSNNATVTVDGAGDVDTVRNVENIRATDGNDYLAGDALANTFWGLEGDDRFIGSGGTDTYYGGEDLDGLDQDEVDYSGATQRVVVDLSNNVATEDGTGATDNIFDIENVIGSNFSDIIQGDANANILEGRNLDDTFIYSGGGDTIDGGTDSDTVDYSASGATNIVVTLTASTYTTVTVVDGDDEDIRNVENVIATGGDDIVRGDGQSNTFTLLGGNDIARGGLLADDFDGGDDYDTLYWDDLSGGIVLNLATADSGTAYFAGDDSTDTFQNFEEYHATNFADQITGSAENDLIFGGAGADTFFVSDGDDTFDGEANDADDNTIGDTINYSSLDATNYIEVTLNGSTAVDSNVRLTANDAILKTDSIVNIENVTGTRGNDIITGDDEVNVLRGDRGNDTLNGGAGNDRLFGDDGDDIFLASSGQNTMYGGAGIDTVDYSADATISSISVTLQGEGLAGVLVDAYSDDFVSQIENVIGTGGTDYLNGDGQVNVLEGRGGDDFISGGAGLDTLDGGDDGANGDTVDYSVVLSNDLVDITLDGANDSTVTIGGIDADVIRNFENVLGSLNRDTIRGDAGVNRLDGNTGDDILVSNGGQDTLVGGDGSDTLDISQDTVHADSAISLTLRGGDTIGVTVGGVANTFYMLQVENVIGSSQNDFIAGDSQINLLEGRDGDDTIRGTGGDTVDGGIGIDTIDHSDLDVGSDVTLDMTNLSIGYGGENYFDVTISGDGTYSAARFRDIITGRGNDDITGDAQDNTITTGEGNDTVYGGDGIDTINTGIGQDYIEGGDGDDIINSGSGIDTVYGGLGNDTIVTGKDNSGDIAYGEEGDDDIDSRTAHGGDGNDIINAYTAYGDDGDDVITNLLFRGEGGDGNDSLTANGSAGYDVYLDGGAGDDTILGGNGDDTIVMSRGTDDLDGSNGVDHLRDTDIDYGTDGTLGFTIYGTDLAGLGETSMTIDMIAGTYTLNDLGDSGTIANIENLYMDPTTNGADYVRTDINDSAIYTYGGDDEVVFSARNGRIVLGTGTDTVDFSEMADSGQEWTIDVQFYNTVDGFNIVQTGGVNSIELVDAERIILSDFADRIQTDNNGSSILEYIDGGAGNDNILIRDRSVGIEVDGGDGDDSIRVWNAGGNATMDGGDGTDWIRYENIQGANGDLTITLGEADEDTIVVKAGDTSRNDTIRNFENVDGSGNRDYITGNSGTNILYGNSGADTFYATAGQDRYRGDGDSDTVDFSTLVGIYGITGITLLYDDGTNDNDWQNVVLNGGGEGDQYVSYSVENIIGTSGDDTLSGTALNNRFETGAGDDYIYLSSGFDQLLAGDLTDTDTLDASLVTLAGATGLNLNAASQVVGFDGNTSTIVGFEVFITTGGNDTITSSNTVDEDYSLEGGTDYYYASQGEDTVDGGAGVDTIDYSLMSTTTGISVTLDGDNPALVTVNGVANSNDTISSFQHVVGSGGNDNITGDGLDNTISGLSGNDTIDGAGGDDYIIGGLGVDNIDGGADTDTVDYSGGQAIDVDLENNVVADDGQFFNDTIDNVEIILGSSSDDSIIGDDLDNELYGNGGDDVLQGREGDDILSGGGQGDNGDTASYSRAGGSVTASIADGGTTVGGDGDGDTDTFIGIENLTGSNFGDFLTGNGQANTIDGGAGNDVIYSGGGVDDYIGGAGNDDVLDFSAAGQRAVVNLTAGTVTEDGYGSNDTIAGIENIVGSNQGDIVTTNDQNNDLSLGLGDDTIHVADAGVNNYDGGGETATGDTVNYSLATNAVTADLSSGASNNGFAGVDNYTSIENLVGSDFDDDITGSSAANTISTGDGDDYVTASQGVDTIDAGEGAEDNGGDTLDFTGGTQSVNWNMTTGVVTNNGYGDTGTASNFENFVGTNQGDTVTGNNDGNTFTLGSGDDIINAGSGNDLIYGSAGMDTLDAQGGNADLIDYSLVGAVDVDLLNEVASSDGSGSNDILRGFERVRGSNSGDVIFGNDLDNVINAGGGDDRVGGGLGADTLDGQGGTNTVDYSRDNGDVTADLTAETANDGSGATDTIRNFHNYIGTDNGVDDVRGTAGVNNIQTGLGDDIIRATTGADTYAMGGGLGDTVDFSEITGSGVVVDLDSTSATLTDTADVQTLTGVEDIIGSDFDDTFTGTTGVDNEIFAGTGDDTFIATSGDNIYRGEGNTATGDTVDYSANAAVVVDLSGNTATNGLGGTDQLFGIENIEGSASGDTITGNGSGNTLSGNGGDDTLRGLGGVDTLDGGANGANGDTADYSGLGGVVSVDLSGGAVGSGVASQDGSGSNDILIGIENVLAGENNDTIIGDAANNRFEGNGGNDTLRGMGGVNYLDGGTGTNTVDYTGAGAVTVDLGSDAASNNGYSGGSDTLINIQNVIGSGSGDNITGQNSQANRIESMGGADTIIATSGSNYYDGGAGTDTVNYSAASGIVVDLSNDTASDNGFGGSDDLFNIENIIATADADQVTTNGLNNTITLAGGDDVLYSTGGGTNTFDGGAHDSLDILDYSSVGSAVTLDMNAGTASYTGGSDSFSNFERINLTSNIDNITTESGAASGIDIYAGAGADNITLQGNQTVYAQGGDDTFTVAAGASNVTIDGGTDVGGDTLTYASLGSAITSGSLVSGSSTINTSATTVNFTDIENIIGSSVADSITHTSGAYDISLGNGNDTIFINASGANSFASSYDGGGNAGDTVNYSGQSSAVTINLDTDTANHGGGNYTVTNFEDVVGSAQADIITNSSSGGNDIDAGAGNDTVYSLGGNNNDFDGGSNTGAGDEISYENFGSAINGTLNGTITYAGGSDSLTGFENITGTSQNDTITGDGNGNTIDGGAGDDTLNGGAGDDIIIGGANGATGDTVTYADGNAVTVDLSGGAIGAGTATGNGSDTLQGIENIIGSAFGDTIDGDDSDNDLYGLDGDDDINAHDGNDYIDGGAGSDTINAGAGDDIIIVEGADSINGSGGTDTADLTGAGAGATGTFSNSLGGNITISGDTAIINNVENYLLSNFDDSIEFNETAINNIVSRGGDFDFGGDASGDTVVLTSDITTTLTGADFANAFSNVEAIDMRSVGFTGGATQFTISNANVAAMTDGANVLRILIDDSAITLNDFNITGSVASDTGSADTTRTITWSDGSQLIIERDVNTINGTGAGETINGTAASDDISAAGGDDTINGSNGNDIIDGGAHGPNGDTVDYSSASANVDVDLGNNTASDDGEGGYDTLYNVENVIGSNFADTITGDGNANTLNGGNAGDTINGAGGNDTIDGDAGDDIVNGGAGDDYIYSGQGADDIDGGANNDTVDFSVAGSGVTSGLFDGVGDETVTISGNTTTITGIENVIFTGQDDTVTFTEAGIDALNGLGTGNTDVDFGAGSNDQITFSGDIGTTLDGSDFASLFQNVEIIDFSSSDFTGGATDFAISNSDVIDMTDGNDSLTILIDGTNITHNDFDFGAIDTDTGVIGNARTITWADGTEVTIQS